MKTVSEQWLRRADISWVLLMEEILKDGKPSRPRGLEIRELLCKTTRTSMLHPVVTIPARKMGYRFMFADAWWVLTGRNDVASIAPYSKHIASFSNDGHRFDGAYGPRVVDQLRYVVDSLEKDQHSRQAVMEIWRPNPRNSKDVPCTVALQWLIRGDTIHCIDTMRSSDAWLGWVYDTFTFTCLTTYLLLLLRKRSKWFSTVKLGDIFLTAGSSHLYVDPAADGASNIPYSLKDVESAIGEARCHPKFCYEHSDKFDSPDLFIDWLYKCKEELPW